MDLLGQFACGRDDEGTHVAVRTLDQTLQNRQGERRGFAGTSLRQTHHVGALLGRKTAASATDENDDRAVGFLDRDRVAQALGLSAADIRDDLPLQVASTGVPYLYVPLRSLEAIGRCRPNPAALEHWGNGLLLDGGRRKVPERLHPSHDTWMEIEHGKTH